MDTVIENEKGSDTLNSTDRCDACRSQAYVWANGVAGDLLFCRHHFLKNEEKIRAWAFEIIDESYKADHK